MRDVYDMTIFIFYRELDVRDISSEGDLHPFAFVAGIPSINLRFVNGKYNRTAGYFPTQHSQFDTFGLVKSLDKGIVLVLLCL